MNTTPTDEKVLILSRQVSDAAAALAAPRDAISDLGNVWVLDQALAGRHLPMNESSVKALTVLLADLRAAA